MKSTLSLPRCAPRPGFIVRHCLSVVPLALLASCATLHSAYQTNVLVPPASGKEVTAEESKLVFLAFNFSNEYAMATRDKLAESCPGGRVTGVLSTYETYWHVLFTKYVIRARGTCLSKTR